MCLGLPTCKVELMLAASKGCSEYLNGIKFANYIEVIGSELYTYLLKNKFVT